VYVYHSISVYCAWDGAEGEQNEDIFHLLVSFIWYKFQFVAQLLPQHLKCHHCLPMMGPKLSHS
jgi:hypothetical protein